MFTISTVSDYGKFSTFEEAKKALEKLGFKQCEEEHFRNKFFRRGKDFYDVDEVDVSMIVEPRPFEEFVTCYRHGYVVISKNGKALRAVGPCTAERAKGFFLCNGYITSDGNAQKSLKDDPTVTAEFLYAPPKRIKNVKDFPFGDKEEQ